MQWLELLAGLDVAELTGDAHVEVTAITHDSRLVEPGACFACIPGDHVDGHDFAAAALEAGAAALLVERAARLPRGVKVPACARVPSVRRALGPASANLFHHPSRALSCFGITGTNGKTTTTYLLESIARATRQRVGVIGTLGARITDDSGREDLRGSSHTTPEANELQAFLAHMRDVGVGTVAMEVSSHALHQGRVDATWFAVACFTNLSHEHLDYHETIDAYFDAKATLFDSDRTAAAAVNVGDAHGRKLVALARERGLDVWTFAPDAGEDLAAAGLGGVDVRAEDVRFDANGTYFMLVDRRSGTRVDVDLGLVGQFNLENALAASTTARAAGFDLATIAAGLRAPVLVPGRFERVDAGQPFTVLVDYAHTPNALDRVLDAARRLATTDGRLLLVFGCGGDRDRGKRPLMGRVAGDGADVAVVTSDNPRSETPDAISAAVLIGLSGRGAEVVVEHDRRAAIGLALGAARAGDVVVIAGKGHEVGQTTGARTVPFDDRMVVRDELGALGWS